jgi:hypothetical protein
MSKKPAPEAPKNSPTDPAAAKKAYEAMSPRMAALGKDDLALVNIDGQEAVIIALTVSRFLDEPETRARFALLNAKTFDPAHLGDLATIALTLSHAYVELQAARAQTTEAKLPITLVDKATAVKTRMLECTEYLFKRHGTLAKEVASIRAGTGYRDTASDLLRLAKIYAEKKSTVEKDPLNYRDTDEADARTYAQEILTELGKAQSAEEQRCGAAMARAWTLLRETYGEVQWAGQFLYRHEEPEEKFPSLYANSGAGRPRKKKATEAAPGGGGEGGAAGGGGK